MIIEIRILLWAIFFLSAIVIWLSIITSEQKKETRTLKAQLLHCQAFDSTDVNHEFGEDRVWDALTTPEKAYWLAKVEEGANDGH